MTLKQIPCVRLATRAAVLVAAVAFASIGFAYAAPSSIVNHVGNCSGMRAIAKLTDPAVPESGLRSLDDRGLALTARGVDPDVFKGTDLGSCIFDPGPSTPDAAKPPVPGYNGTKTIKSWSLSLSSPEIDCNPEDTDDLTEWALSGKMKIVFNDLLPSGKPNFLVAEIVVGLYTNPDHDPRTYDSNVVRYHGVVSQGVARGSYIDGELWTEFVTPDRSQLTSSPYFGYVFDAGAMGCQDPIHFWPPNISHLVIGDGTSPRLFLPASGITFTTPRVSVTDN
jgi:hypothetical protein